MSLYKLVIIHDTKTETFTLQGFNEINAVVGGAQYKWSHDGAQLTFNSLEETLHWLKKNYK